MSFENPSRPVIEKNETHPDLREYFESYVSDAETHEDQAARDGFVDLDAVKEILASIDKGEYSSAREYLDAEISRMQGIQQELAEKGFVSDIEEGRPYLEKITALRNSLS